MKLKVLLKEVDALTVKGSKEIEITGISAHSKAVAPGHLFIVKKGLSQDGAAFIEEAILAGARAILTPLYNPFLKDVTQIICSNIEEMERILLDRFYQFPQKKLSLIGITGTNGKTTVSYLIHHLISQEKNHKCGLIGTIEWRIGDKHLTSSHTTPDRVTLMRLMAEMVGSGCTTVSMEVSSHALEQGRVEGLEFNCAIFTNLTQDHLDYHGTLENYARAKGKLFLSLTPDKVAIVNQDSSWTPFMLEGCRAKKISYGFDPKADLRAENLEMTAQGMAFDVCYGASRGRCKTTLIGRFNVYNCLSAIGAVLSFGLPLERILKHIASFSYVPGRLQRVPNGRGLNIFVDYAHTEDALRNVLETLAEFKKGKIITVFGCGGNRDTFKRPKMARVAEELSDRVFVTSDNPRHEKPEDIVAHMRAGFQKEESYVVEIDRRLAIYEAVKSASPEDIVLIAGKGHEKFQVIGYQQIPFDDCLVAQEALGLH